MMPHELRAIELMAKAQKQSVSEWVREIARHGTTLQPLSPDNPKGVVVIPACPECRALAAKTLVLPICDSCRAKQTEGRLS
jgi:hypothetical protein